VPVRGTAHPGRAAQRSGGSAPRLLQRMSFSFGSSGAPAQGDCRGCSGH
jgi:hypothetical protein